MWRLEGGGLYLCMICICIYLFCTNDCIRVLYLCMICICIYLFCTNDCIRVGRENKPSAFQVLCSYVHAKQICMTSPFQK